MTEDRPQGDVPPDDATQRVDQAEIDRLVAEIDKTTAGDVLAGGRCNIGQYRVVRQIGRGSMGTVFLARHDKLDRDIALKVLPSTIAFDHDARARFLREARAMARIEHPSAVRIHDVLESDGALAIAMEFVDGRTLAEVVEHLRSAREDGASAPSLDEVAAALGTDRSELRGEDYSAWVARVGRDLANALQAVHDSGLAHRDVKPSNVLVDRDGRAHLADFGVVREADATLTRAGGFVGTAPYASPEQLRGELDIDARADVYGLGATLYELLALEPPVSGSPATILDTVQRGAVPPLARRAIDTSRDLASVVQHAIEPEVDRRYPSALAMAADLQAFVEGRPVAARPPTALERLALWARREPARARLVAAVTVAVIGLLVVGGYVLSQLPRIRAAAEIERRERFDELVQSGFGAAELPSRAGQAIDLFESALEVIPDEPAAILGLSLVVALERGPVKAREVLEQYADVVAVTPGLRYLETTGVDLMNQPTLEEEPLLAESVDPFECFVAGLAARHRAHAAAGSRWFEAIRVEAVDKAAKLLERATKLAQPTPSLYRAEWLIVAMLAGDRDETRLQAAVIERTWPDSPALTERRLAALGRLNTPDDNRLLLESPELSTDRGAGTAFLRGKVLQRIGRTDEAIAVCERLLADPAWRVEGLLDLIRIHDRSGDPEKADAVRVELVETLRPMVEGRTAAGLHSYGPGESLVGALFELGRLEEAVRTNRTLVEACPDDWRSQVSLQSLLGEYCRKSHVELRRSGARDPELRARVVALSEEIRTRGLAAVEQNPENAFLITIVASTLTYPVSDYESALPLLLRHLAAYPDDGSKTVALGLVYFALGRFEDAIAPLTKACETEARRPGTYGQLGWSLLENGRHEEALRAFDGCEELIAATGERSSWRSVAKAGAVLGRLRSADRGEIDLASERAVLASLPRSLGHFSDILIDVVGAELAHAGGDEGAAQDLLDRARAQAERLGRSKVTRFEKRNVEVFSAAVLGRAEERLR